MLDPQLPLGRRHTLTLMLLVAELNLVCRRARLELHPNFPSVTPGVRIQSLFKAE